MSNSNSAFSKTTWVGLDVHRDSITSAVLSPQSETPVVDRWFHDEPCVRRFVSGLGNPAQVRLCYEAGPTGYDLARLLKRIGVATEVIAPFLIPVTPGAKIKTDSRDARRLVHLYRSGELTAVHIPTPEEEVFRDLARTADRDRSHPIEAPAVKVPAPSRAGDRVGCNGRPVTRPGFARCATTRPSLRPFRTTGRWSLVSTLISRQWSPT